MISRTGSSGSAIIDSILKESQQDKEAVKKDWDTNAFDQLRMKIEKDLEDIDKKLDDNAVTKKDVEDFQSKLKDMIKLMNSLEI